MITLKQDIIYNKVKAAQKQIFHCSLFTLTLGMMLASCSDWDDHYEASASEGGNLTLWQQMQANPQLSDFCQVLENTKVFRMHKKTAVSYSQLLDGGQMFTVVAPVNGTFNRDSLLQLTATNQGDSLVEKFFIFNHLSRSTTSLKADAKPMLMLNSKFMPTDVNSIGGVPVTQANQHAKNGVLHVASTPLPYTYNLYEALSDMPDMSGIGYYLRQYEWDWFNANASVSSGIVDGVPVYVDSVVVEYNRMLDYIGLINAEDSTYWVVAPTAAGWQKAWNETSKYFVYPEDMAKRDSLQQFFTTYWLLEDAVFNMTDQKTTQDSIVSVPYPSFRRTWVSGMPIYHVFHKPFEPGGILYGAEKVTCSNGVLYKTNEWPFTPEQTFFKELWTEGEHTYLVEEEKSCSYNERREVADSISNNAYLRIIPEKSTSNWELTFRLLNTLSGHYDVCAVLLPKHVSDQVNPDLRPCKFKATINYVDEQGKEQSFNCNNTQFRSDPLKVDTVVLAENFFFPACNFNENNKKITLKLQCSILARETSTFAREMYLDCIYLRPRRVASGN